MGNRVLNTALLSLATVSVLSTNAFADVTTSFAQQIDTFTKKAGRLDLFQIDLKASTVSKLNSITVTLKDSNQTFSGQSNECSNELAYAVLTDLKIYQRGLDNTDIIGTKTIGDINCSGKDVTVSFTDKTILFKTADDINPNRFYVSATYGDFPSETVVNDKSEVRAIVKSVNVTENYYTDVTNKVLNTNAVAVDRAMTIAGVVESGSGNYDRNVSIDRAAPVQNSVKSITGMEYAGTTNTNYYFPDNNLTFYFDSKYNTNLVSLASVKTAFKAVDSENTEIPIENVITTKPNELTLTFNQSALNMSVGNIILTYSGTILQDDFGNEVASDSNLTDNSKLTSIIHKDNTSPQIASFTLDFDDKSKGSITFSELVFPISSWSSIKLTNSEANVISSTIVPRRDQNTDQNNSYRTIIDFDFNKTVTTANFNITYEQGKDTNITDKVGHNLNTTIQAHAPEFVDFNLTQGWNLISLNDKTRTTSKHILKTGSAQMIWEYLGNGKWNAFPSSLVAGKGYWVKSVNNITLYPFSTVEVGTTKVVDVDENTFIKNATKNSWELLGTVKDITRIDAYSQVADGCYGVAIYDYNASASAWNVDENIYKNRGIWVKQDCLTNE